MSRKFKIHLNLTRITDSFHGNLCKFEIIHLSSRGVAVAEWLRCCATNRKVAGSIPTGVARILFIDIILPIALWLLNRNEYQEHFLGIKAAGTQG